jgi:hypothetical protein
MLKDLLSKLRLHLGIEWTAAMPSPAPASQAMWLIPPKAALHRLLELGSIGYVKGIHAELDAIAEKNTAYAPFCAELRSLVERFRLPEYTNRLKEWIHDDMDHV